jgi:uncharacterized paraquat-inducible protein A
MGIAISIEKSTIQAISMLNEKERYVASTTILVCSVIAPFVKLAVMLLCAYFMWSYEKPGPAVNSMIAGVRRISKWATVDAFTASIFVGLFASAQGVTVNLHRGFFCFMGYCILSVAGALLLEQPDKDDMAEQRSLIVASASSKRVLLPSVAGILMTAGLVVAWKYPLLQMNLFFHQEEVSLATIVERVWSQESRVAAASFVLLAFVFPAADLIWVMVEAFLGNANRSVGEFLQDFAMLDVFALSVLVVANAASGINAMVTVKVLPAGWFLCVCCAVWVIYSLVFRVQPMPRMFLSKDKLGPGADVAHKA